MCGGGGGGSGGGRVKGGKRQADLFPSSYTNFLQVCFWICLMLLICFLACC